MFVTVLAALREKTNEERDKLKQDPVSLGVQVLLPNPTSYLASVSGTPLLLPGVQPPSVVVPTASAKTEVKEVAAKGEEAGKTEEQEKQEEKSESKTEDNNDDNNDDEEAKKEAAEPPAEGKGDDVQTTSV